MNQLNSCEKAVFKTGQSLCYNEMGAVIPCADTGQDGALQMGVSLPGPRFLHGDAETVIDNLTGLMWTKDANLSEFPLMWQEAGAYVQKMNVAERFGYGDWRLPTRKELFSLVSHASVNPALPASHPFVNVFTGYYWTSTTCARLPSQAWYVHLGGARVFKGMKHGSYMVWPVRSVAGGTIDLPCSGPPGCRGESGNPVQLEDFGQDGVPEEGTSWLGPRFLTDGQVVLDKLTGIEWPEEANLIPRAVNWKSALDAVKAMNGEKTYGFDDWRLPNIRELESLCDMGTHSPALPSGYPFERVQEYYWSSTTSTYDPKYAWVLYLRDGAVGVGYKAYSDCFVWVVRSGQH